MTHPEPEYDSLESLMMKADLEDFCDDNEDQPYEEEFSYDDIYQAQDEAPDPLDDDDHQHQDDQDDQSLSSNVEQD